MNLIVNELFPIADLATRFTSGVTIVVDEQRHGVEGLQTLREITRGYPGDKPMKLQLRLANGGTATLEAGQRLSLETPSCGVAWRSCSAAGPSACKPPRRSRPLPRRNPAAGVRPRWRRTPSRLGGRRRSVAKEWLLDAVR